LVIGNLTMNIYLVGFMGTGKSSAGKALAKRKKWQFVDLDELIELREGRAISAIFANKGEPYFRRLETRILKEVALQKKFIVSCGGGIVLNEDNIALMKKTGKVICLSATPQVILKRVSNTSKRPLLNVDNPLARIEHLLKLRAPYYVQADFQISTSRLSVDKVVAKVIQTLSKVGHP
jgi:shikimate kinase